jgi:predicted peptidase
LGLWIGANYAVLPWIDIYDSKVLESEYHVPAGVIRSYESRTTTVPLKRSQKTVPITYRFRPPHSSAKTQTVPLVVYLHGGGECGSDNVRQLQGLPSLLCEETMRKLYPCAVLVPQCPLPGDWAQQLDAHTDLLDAVAQVIDDVLTDSRIDPNRIYLTGQSLGGFGSWELAVRVPARFAAVVPICGGGDEGRAARLVHVPVWAVHGEDDDVIAASETRAMIDAMKSAGGQPHYLELPGVGHDSWTAVYRQDSDVLAWMFRQARNSSSASTGDH